MLGSTVAVIAAVTVRHDLVDFVFRSGTPRAATTKAAMTPLSPNAALPGSTTSNARKINDPKLTFDVVRIDRDASVFAGRAPPNSDVTITANGRAVASATADETGAWATVTEQEIAPGEYEFSLRAKSEHSAVTTGQTVRMAVAPTSSIITASPTRQATSRQLIPAPITFLYNETIFTKEGRQAATLLAKHLTSQQVRRCGTERSCGRAWFGPLQYGTLSAAFACRLGVSAEEWFCWGARTDPEGEERTLRWH